jgi:uncharacterized protein (TIGR02001 family)
MRSFVLAAAALLGLAAPAAAQVRLGDTGVSVTATGTFASDYLFRGISQTRSRPATQATVEASHDSGVYVGAFISHVRYAGTDARQEIDLFGGYRFTFADFNFDIGAIWYTYPGYDRAPGAFRLNYAEATIKVSREVGPVTLGVFFAGSPNFFGSSGTGIYVEGQADWKTGIWDVTLGARVAHQWIERNARFGTPDYAWWALTASRDFAIEGVGTITASVGYYQTSIRRSECVPLGPRGQDICGARALGAISFKF